MHIKSTVTLSTFLMEVCPFVNFSMCPLNNFEILEDIFLKLGTNIKGHQMICRERLHNSTYRFHVIMPHRKFQYADCVRSITLKHFEIFSQISVQIQRIMRRCAMIKNLLALTVAIICH